MKLLLIILLGLFSFSTSAQINQCIEDRYAQTAMFDSVDIEQDLYTYSIEEVWPSATLDTLQLEVFKPSNSVDALTKRPFILMIHGGAFLAGNRHEMDYFSMEMARRGFVTASMDYRLGWNCNPSSAAAICFECGNEAAKLRISVYRAMQDTRAALNFIIENADQLGIDTSQIFLQGTSAGAITALQTAFMDQTEADAYCANCVTELGQLTESGLTQVHPFTIKGIINNCGAVNALGIMDNHTIPVVGFHDEWDCTVPYQGGNLLGCLGCTAFQYASGSDAIRSKLNTEGVCYGMNRVMATLNHCSYPSNAIIGKASCFIKSILCGTCTSYITESIWDIPDCTDGTTTMGLSDVNESKLTLYPNPTSSTLNIESEYAIKAVHVISISGESVKSSTGTIDLIDLKELKSGIYFIKLTDEIDQTFIRRIEKQ